MQAARCGLRACSSCTAWFAQNSSVELLVRREKQVLMVQPVVPRRQQGGETIGRVSREPKRGGSMCSCRRLVCVGMPWWP